MQEKCSLLLVCDVGIGWGREIFWYSLLVRKSSCGTVNTLTLWVLTIVLLVGIMW